MRSVVGIGHVAIRVKDVERTLDFYVGKLGFEEMFRLDRDGQAVQGVPLKLKQAVAEYAVRSLASQLDPDPTVDDSGALVQRKREKVGPIEEETEYVAGAQPRIDRPYPAADGLLADYLVSGAGVIR